MATKASGGHGGRGLPVHESAEASSPPQPSPALARALGDFARPVRSSLVMLAGGVAAKLSHCRKDCKQEITNCLALVPKNGDCTGTRAEKRACRRMHAAERATCHTFVKVCKQQNPGTSGVCLPSSTTTTRPPTTTSTTTSSTSTTTLVRYGPVTGLHYAPNKNFDSSGHYVPAKAGFNLADVSSVGQLDSLPSGVKGLVYLGLCNGADSSFINAVQLFIGHAKLFGFYLMDQPDPTGRWGPLCPAANLMAESDWIHANLPGALTFIVMINVNTSTAPVYANTYNPGNSHIDLYAPNPYPCRTEVGGCDYSRITRAIAAAEAAGIPRDSIVPVYQAFGGGGWSDDGGGQYTLPTASQEQQILATWAPLVPNPVFDYAYSWGTQNSDQALEGSTTLQAVFSAHNATSAGPRDRGSYSRTTHARQHLGHLLRSEWTSFQLVAPVVTVTSSSPRSRSPRLGSYDAVPADRSRRRYSSRSRQRQ